MKRVVLYGLMAAGAAAGSAYAADDTGAFYISGLGTYTMLDGHRVSEDDFGYSVELGKDFSPNWAGEINYDNGSFKIRNSGFSQKLSGYSVDGLYRFLPDSIFRPYLLAGGGLLDDAVGTGEKQHGFMAEAGIGLLTGIGSQTGSTRVQLRTQAKYRLEWANPDIYGPKDPSDLIFGVGLQVSFGAPVAQVAVAPPPPPPPPPEAAAPPPPPPAPEPCHAPAGFQVDANCHIIEQKVIVRAVDFEFNSTRLTVPAQETLDDIDHALLNQPELQIEIQGYTDSVGADAYNLNLSRKRAQAVKAYLVSKGVNDSVLTAKGYGKADPIASNATAEGRAQNRRVAFVVTNAPAHLKVVTEGASAESTEAAQQGQPAKTKKEPPQH
jgi:OmpA-OmpF porin, OOP family